jgi:hypothetical protein
MNRFYDWYLFDYVKDSTHKKYIELFLEVKGGDEEFAAVVSSIKSSLFEFHESRFFKKNVFLNLLSRESYQLIADHPKMLFVDNDLVLGYAGLIDGQLFFLEGVTSLCRRANKLIFKESKRIRKLKEGTREREFLYQLELLDLRYQHYQHVEPEKIYKFTYE